MIASFRERFGPTQQVRVFRAPGRVNLIGEHTDYNLGFVLPVALDLATYIAAAPSADGKLHIYSENRQELREFDVSQLGSVQPAREWTDYPVGVAQELVRAGIPLEGVNLLIRSTVPDGSGLSSSAALEVASALAMLAGREFDPLELAKLCQRAERNFVGMPCGIMDQYISIFGRAAVRLWKLWRFARSVQRDPNAKAYTDAALIGSTSDHSLEMFQLSESARKAGERARRIEEHKQPLSVVR